MSVLAINPAHGVIDETGDLVYVLRFESDNPISRKQICNDLQDILYDDLGSSGHFRIAPKHRKDLNPRWISGGYPNQPPLEFMESEDNEIHVAFVVRGDDSEYPLSKELPIISTEVAEFCSQTDLRCQQVDVRNLY